MSRVKKIIKAGEGTKTNPTTQPQYKKFKLGNREIDLTDDFYNKLDEELRNNGVQGSGVSDILDLIKNGGIQGIDSGGSFYGTNIGGTEKHTRRNRLWNIGNKDVIERQNALPGISDSIWNVYNNMNKPKEISKIDLNTNLRNIISKYAYHGNKLSDEYWNSIPEQERWDVIGKSIEGYGNRFNDLGDWDENKYTNISKDMYNNLRNNRSTIKADWDALKSKVFSDNKVDPAELNNFMMKYGLDASNLFDKLKEEVATPEQAAAAKEAEEKIQEAKQEEIDKSLNDRREDFYKKNLDNNYEYSGAEDSNPEDMSNWKRVNPDGSLYSGYSEYEKWNPYSNEKTAGHWVNGKYYGMNPDLSNLSPAERNDIQLLLNENKNIWNNRYNIGEKGEAERKKKIGLDYFGYQDWINMGKQFSKGNKKLFSVKTETGPLYKYYDDASRKMLSGRLERMEDGTINFVSNDGKRVDLGVYNDDSSLLDYDLSGIKFRNKSEAPRDNTKVIYYGRRPYMKNGGKIKKMQFGGRSYKPVSAEKIKAKSDWEKADSERVAKTSEVKNYLNNEGSLTTADKWQLGSLAADLTSAIAGFVPGGSVVSGVAGAGSSLATFGSDVARDGIDWGDVGNLAMNIGLDAATLIPVAGQTAKMSKIVRALNKSKKLLTIGFGLYGANQGLQGLKALDKGVDNMTLDDWRNILSGLRAVSLGGKHAVGHLGTKDVNTKYKIKMNGRKVGNFKSKEEAASFRDTHQKMIDKSSRLAALREDQKLSPSDKTSKKIGSLESKVNKMKESYKNKLGVDFDENAKFQNRKSRILRKDKGDYETYSESERAVRGEGDGNIIQRGSAWWLRNTSYKHKPIKSGKVTEDNQTVQNNKADTEAKAKPTETKPVETKPVESSTSKGNKPKEKQAKTNNTSKPKTEDSKKDIFNSRVNPRSRKSKTPTREVVQSKLGEHTKPKSNKEKFLDNVKGKSRKYLESTKETYNKAKDNVKKRIDELKSKDYKVEAKKAEAQKVKDKVSKKAEEVKDGYLNRRKKVVESEESRKADKAKSDSAKKLLEEKKSAYSKAEEAAKKIDKSLSNKQRRIQSNKIFDKLGLSNEEKTKLRKAYKLQSGGIAKSYIGDNDQEIGKGWKKLKGAFDAITSPQNARLANTFITNNKMMNEVEGLQRPTMSNPIRLNRMEHNGLGSIMPQLTDINSSMNDKRPLYSDAKLNTLATLSRNSNGMKMKQDLYNKLSESNRQIDANNSQIEQQERLQNQGIAERNAAKMDAYRQWILTNKLGLINSTGSAISNRLLESEREKTRKESALNELMNQANLIKLKREYNNSLDRYTDLWNKRAGDSDLNEYLNKNNLNKEYKRGLNKINDKHNLNIINLKKGLYMKSGGKMTIEEKKELQMLKDRNKAMLESDKAFNKLVMESGKSHQKMLSLLSKDLRLKVKEIMKK